MEKTTKDKLKQVLLVFFVIACIVIISIFWQSSLLAQEGSGASPGATLLPTPTSLGNISIPSAHLQLQVLGHLMNKENDPISGGELHLIGGIQLWQMVICLPVRLA